MKSAPSPANRERRGGHKIAKSAPDQDRPRLSSLYTGGRSEWRASPIGATERVTQATVSIGAWMTFSGTSGSIPNHFTASAFHGRPRGPVAIPCPGIWPPRNGCRTPAVGNRWLSVEPDVLRQLPRLANGERVRQFMGMSAIEQIEKTVSALPVEQRVLLAQSLLDSLPPLGEKWSERVEAPSKQ
ncbi:MAG: hypothetical protein JXQ71_11040 [Verrucomicrobia bacterium]|nr:hypothetical protein [Verrucomicrobiota bacterium]